MLSTITSMDFAFLDFIQNNIRCAFLDFVMPIITAVGNGGVVWVILGIIFMSFKKYRKCGAAILIGMVLCLVLGNLILKPVIARPRPCFINPNVELLIKMPKDFSFPSGHTYSAFAAAFVILLCRHRRIGIFVLVLSALIAFSRMYLYVHFPTDILGGIVLAALVAVVSYNIVCIVFSRIE